MRSFVQDLKYAIRSLRNAPGFALIAVVTLGLGMAVKTTVFTVINGLLLRSLPVPNPQEITVLALKQQGTDGIQNFSYLDFQDIRSQAASVGEVFGYRTILLSLVSDGRGDHCVMSRVSGNYFSTLGVKPALGRLILPTEGQTPHADPVIVLSYTYWQKRFNGAPSVIGKMVEVDDRPMTVVWRHGQRFHGHAGVHEHGRLRTTWRDHRPSGRRWDNGTLDPTKSAQHGAHGEAEAGRRPARGSRHARCDRQTDRRPTSRH